MAEGFVESPILIADSWFLPIPHLTMNEEDQKLEMNVRRIRNTLCLSPDLFDFFAEVLELFADFLLGLGFFFSSREPNENLSSSGGDK